MSTEQAGKRTADNQGPTGPGPSQIEAEETGLMTPWLRRRFGLGPGSGERPGGRKGRLAGVATERIRRLLARVRSTRERARVWKPDIGSLRPELVQRFSAAIARRHERLQLVSVRRRFATEGDPWRDALELTLPTGAPPAAERTRTPPGKLKGPSIFSVGQPIPRLSPQIPSTSRPSRQSRGPSRPEGQPQRREPPAQSRLYSRVEEVTSAGRKPPAEAEEPAPVAPEMDLGPQEADLESPELAGEPPLQDTEPSPEGERPSPPSPEPAPPRAQPTIQRRAVDARAPTPSRRQPSPSRSRKPRVERTPAQPPAEELEAPPAQPPAKELEAPPPPPSETTISPGEPGPEVAERQAADELPLRPAPSAPSPTPPQQRAAGEPSPPRREQRTPRQVDTAPPSSADRQPSRGEPAPLRQRMPVHREEEETPSGPSRAPTPPAEPVQAVRPAARVEEPAARPRPAEAQPLSPAGREQPQAPRSKPVESAPMAEQVQRQPLPEVPAEDRQPPKPEDEAVGTAREGAEPGPEMVLRRPPVPPEAADQQTEKPEPVMEVTRPRSTPGVQRQLSEAADRQAPPVLSADGRRILARARSRARATLTKLMPTRHRPPEAGPLPTGAAKVPYQPIAAGLATPGHVQRQRRHRPGSLTLYGRGPEVRIGPDSSLPVTRRIAGTRPHRESGPGKPRERPGPAIPPEVRSLLSAIEGRAEGGVRGEGLPLPRLPSPSAPGGTSIQRATGGTPARQGPPGGGSEPPWLPPPPPEEPSLPLARPPAPRESSAQITERTSGIHGVVQRAPDGPVGTLQREPAVVQRAREDEEVWEEIDLPDLARRVYPVIKRLLSIERERTRGRSL